MSFQKHDQGKVRPGQVPAHFRLDLAAAMTEGAIKYGPRNYRQGCEWSRYVDAMERHWLAWLAGEDIDPDSGISHLAKAAACLAILHDLQRLGLGEDDR